MSPRNDKSGFYWSIVLSCNTMHSVLNKNRGKLQMLILQLAAVEESPTGNSIFLFIRHPKPGEYIYFERISTVSLAIASSSLVGITHTFVLESGVDIIISSERVILFFSSRVTPR